MKIILPNVQIQIAYLNGKMRYESSRQLGFTEGNNLIQEEVAGRSMDFLGAIGEMAAGEALNLMPHFIPGYLARPDLGFSTEVRAIPEKGRRLIIKQRDVELGKRNCPFISVYVPANVNLADDRCILYTTDETECELIGWCWGYEGIKSRFLCDPSGKNRDPAYFVERSVLHKDWDVLLKHEHQLSIDRTEKPVIVPEPFYEIDQYDQIQYSSVAKSSVNRQRSNRSQA